MILRFVIFLFIYAASATISTGLAHIDYGYKAIFEDGFEDKTDQESLANHWANLLSTGPAFLTFFTQQHGAVLPNINAQKNSLEYQRNRSSQRPLFLLFHSFLFYDFSV